MLLMAALAVRDFANRESPLRVKRGDIACVKPLSDRCGSATLRDFLWIVIETDIDPSELIAPLEVLDRGQTRLLAKRKHTIPLISLVRDVATPKIGTPDWKRLVGDTVYQPYCGIDMAGNVNDKTRDNTGGENLVLSKGEHDRLIHERDQELSDRISPDRIDKGDIISVRGGACRL